MTTEPPDEFLRDLAAQAVKELGKLDNQRAFDILLDLITRTAARVIVTSLHSYTSKKYGAELEALLGVDWSLDRAVLKQAAALMAALTDEQAGEILGSVQLGAFQAATDRLQADDGIALREVPRGAKQFSRVRRAWKTYGDDELDRVGTAVALDLARQRIRAISPDDRTVDELAELLQAPSEEPIRLAAAAGIMLPVDRGLQGLTRFFAGEEAPRDYRQDSDGRTFAVLQNQRANARGATRETRLQVRFDFSPEYTELITADNTDPVLAKIMAEKNEPKAKLLLAVFAAANDDAVTNPQEFYLDVDDLNTFVHGYRRTTEERDGKVLHKTNAAYYHRGYAEMLRYLLLDFPSTQVNIKVMRGTVAQGDAVMAEYLMHRPRLVTREAVDLKELYSHLRTLVEGDDPEAEKAAVNHIKNLKIDKVRVGFPKSVLASLGHRKMMFTPSRVFAELSGPAFWLSFDIAFLTRWSRKEKVSDGATKHLLTALDDYGFLRASAAKHHGRVSYKTALRTFFDSVNALLDFGELDDPGVRLWEPHVGPGGHRDITRKVRAWCGLEKARGVSWAKRITQADLEHVRVQYVLSAKKIKLRDEARKRKAASESRRRLPASG